MGRGLGQAAELRFRIAGVSSAREPCAVLEAAASTAAVAGGAAWALLLTDGHRL